MAMCMRYAHTSFEAEDIFQEAFVKIFKNIGTFKNTGSLEGWMKHIVVNTAINHYHSNKKYNNNSDIADHYDITSQEQDVLADITVDELMTLISRLSEGYRLVFNMYVVEGYSHAEIAKILQINEGTSKSQLSKAKNILRNMITNLKHPDYVTG